MPAWYLFRTIHGQCSGDTCSIFDGNHCSNLDGSEHQSAGDLYLIQQRSNKCGFQMVVGHFADLSKMA